MPRHLKRSPLPLALAINLASLTALSVGLCSPVAAQEAARYAIAAGPLGPALNLFAQQAHVALLFDSTTVAGLSTAGLQGDFPINQGFAQLLRGSGLQAVQGANGYVLVPVNTGGALELGPTSITGLSEESSTEHVKGYVATRNLSATKTDTPIIETPQSLSVVTSDEIRDRQSETLSQTLDLTPGFTSQPTSFNRTSDRFRIRGFDVESATGGSLRDGLRLQNNSYDGVQEPYGLERAEVIRGAASVLYGQLSPGGLINTVSKRPSQTPYHEVNLQAGQNNRKQLSADFTGPLGDSDTLSYRLTLLDRKSDTAADHIQNDKVYVAPALTWRPNDDTSLTLLSFYQKTETGFSAPLPYQLTKGVGSGNFQIGRHDFIGEPDYDEMNGEMSALGYEFEHRFDEHTRISHKLRYYQSDVTWRYLQVNTSGTNIATAQTSGLLRRQYSDREERSRGLASDTHIESKWQFGDWQHTFLLGFDGYDTSYDSHNFRGTAQPLNLATYQYGQPVVVNTNPATDRGSQIDTLQKGIYFQDQIKFDERWILLLGGRHDWADQHTELFRNGDDSGKSNEATTWRAGLVYKADNGLAPYISYSESFFPVAGTNKAGESFVPTQGKQYEIGIRYQPEGSATLLSAAVYQLEQRNVLSQDRTDINFSVQVGEVRSRGFELEAKSEVTPNLSLIASYAYIDARITKSDIASEVGQRSEDTPYHQAALWADYRLAALGVPQLRIGGGARYKGTTQASGVPSSMPAYTLYDARASYEIDPNWEVALNANNVTNKRYTYCEFAICRYGDERQLVSSVTYRW
ncbi:TonB-dependent siderophore receptor [Pseudomonas fluorescens]|uniref:TonB-dependent siderophore receptor n=1 Tax=Pseudomonas fluorescens TaxID=294 RepID=UPI0017809132|nr:TonB-dependent siderophore receptor [Pseudomonas fluorescens]MBD8238943.1 TonB-dependent siderophore receptor [Pseudomonas fluorescens]MDY0895638.1 TonB-dependent siderophore receptor [Pseudomonas fluorescens]